jgi:hypothetical protein
MICPHCSTGINVEWFSEMGYGNNPDDPAQGVEVAHGQCPVCRKIIVKLIHGKGEETEYGFSLKQVEQEEIIHPTSAVRPVEPEVPGQYKNDFSEACAVLNISPKASAAVSRRLLQNILRQEFNIEHRSLAKEIEEFIQLKGVPSHLSGAVDAIRNVGNFAAHPLKDTNTGTIVDVEPGEAEWLLDVLEALFDFAFVQPRRLEERKERLNRKLAALGKSPMQE